MEAKIFITLRIIVYHLTHQSEKKPNCYQYYGIKVILQIPSATSCNKSTFTLQPFYETSAQKQTKGLLHTCHACAV